MLRKAALWVGVVFLAIGIMGFIPPLTPGSKILGLFEVDTVHNLIHILSGLAAIVASQRADWSSMYFKVMAVVYGLVTLIGMFIGDGEILGLFHVNTADNFLHLVLTAAFVYFGFFVRPEHDGGTPTATPAV